MAFAQVSSAPWGIGVGATEKETLAPVVDLRNKILVIGAAAIAVLWVISLVVARTLVHPVRVLTKTADRIAAGDLDSGIQVAAGGEIGRLGETLDAMRRRLKASLAEINLWGSELETKVAQRTEALNARNLELTALSAVATTANESRNRDEMVERCLEIVLEQAGMEAGTALLLDAEKSELVRAASAGDFTILPCNEQVIPLGECPCGSVAATGEPLLGDPASFDSAAGRSCDVATLKFAAVLPLISSQGVQGVLYLGSRKPGPLDRERMELLETMCNQLAVAVENGQLFQDLGKMEAMRELERLKSEFMSAVSHELRTPLGLVKGYVTTLLRETAPPDSDTQREFLQIINEEAGRLQHLIDGLLDAARLQSKGLELNRAPEDLQEIAERAAQKLGIAFSDREITLSATGGVSIALIDVWRIEQVIQNLVENAARYSPQGTPIAVSVSRQDPEVLLSVRDQGDGLTKDEVSRIFEPFYRSRAARERSPGGTGLGLTICRGIVEAHDGRMWVESEPGAGSTFIFAVPLAEVAKDSGTVDRSSPNGLPADPRPADARSRAGAGT